MAHDYVYDVFLSYSHSNVVRPWVIDHLYKHFMGWLSENLGGRSVQVFIDYTDIKPGDRWPDRLRDAIRTSKCLVPIWSPGYFVSPWCVSEWKSFCAREELLGLSSGPKGLIIPVLHNDGEDFPKEAQLVQWADFSKCRSNFPGFISHPIAIEFEKMVEEFTKDVARAVRSAPDFSPDWPIVEALPESSPHVKMSRL